MAGIYGTADGIRDVGLDIGHGSRTLSNAAMRAMYDVGHPDQALSDLNRIGSNVESFWLGYVANAKAVWDNPLAAIKNDLSDLQRGINRFYALPLDQELRVMTHTGLGLFTSVLMPEEGVVAGAGAKGLGNTALRSRVLANIENNKVVRGVVEDKFNLFSRKATARSFYADGGWPSAKIDSHLEGIDFQDPVTEQITPKGSILAQHQMPNGVKGNYFTEPGAERSKLGIYTSGRVLNRYMALGDIRTLRSTTADIVDHWSMSEYGWQIELESGETQYFTHDLNSWRLLP